MVLGHGNVFRSPFFIVLSTVSNCVVWQNVEQAVTGLLSCQTHTVRFGFISLCCILLSPLSQSLLDMYFECLRESMPICSDGTCSINAIAVELVK